MNTKLHQKYFTQTKTNPLNYVAILFALVGLICVTFTYDLFAFGVISILVGVALFLTVMGFTVNDNTIDDIADTCKRTFEAEFTNRFNPPVDYKNVSEVRNEKVYIEVYTPTMFKYDEEGVLYKRGKDSKFRSSMFITSGIVVTANKISFARQDHNFIGESKPFEGYKVNYTDLSHCELVETDISARFPGKKYVTMNIFKADGSLLIAIPMLSDAISDEIFNLVSSTVARKIKESYLI